MENSLCSHFPLQAQLADHLPSTVVWYLTFSEEDILLWQTLRNASLGERFGCKEVWDPSGADPPPPQAGSKPAHIPASLEWLQEGQE